MEAVLLIYSSNCQQTASRWLVLRQHLSQGPCLCSVSSRHSISLKNETNERESQCLGRRSQGQQRGMTHSPGPALSSPVTSPLGSLLPGGEESVVQGSDTVFLFPGWPHAWFKTRTQDGGWEEGCSQSISAPCAGDRHPRGNELRSLTACRCS